MLSALDVLFLKGGEPLKKFLKLLITVDYVLQHVESIINTIKSIIHLFC